MPSHFYDTSAIVKYFHPEPGSAHIMALVDQSDNTNRVSWLSVVEIQSAFMKRLRTRSITAPQMVSLRRFFYQALRERRFLLVRWKPHHSRHAVRLLTKHGGTHAFRTLDALQLAVALDLQRQGLIDQFVCADRVLCGIAQSEGMSVINPES